MNEVRRWAFEWRWTMTETAYRGPKKVYNLCKSYYIWTTFCVAKQYRFADNQLCVFLSSKELLNWQQVDLWGGHKQDWTQRSLGLWLTGKFYLYQKAAWAFVYTVIRSWSWSTFHSKTRIFANFGPCSDLINVFGVITWDDQNVKCESQMS